ncbi:MAG: repair protein SbcD/Mre11 [Acidobacteriota bacterium]|jgi:DNA repair exonuclease SbcCD nuclease subunit|nr:repair protein SbcD/Mre11 [Acidobacteriota bacterium]MDT7807434.1 repair protein SbcD/Mre11 [Acidobacteriota bacterium]
MIKFLHMSDVHLGCRRYNLEERTKDFFRSWHDVITRHALPSGVDFVLIAGDFFDRRNIDPQTMNHALAGLQLLKDAGIPVVAIEGNHDRRDAVSPYSWMRSFSQAGFMILLEPTSDEANPISLVPWDEESRSGSYVDIKGARIFGTHWYGTSANAAMTILADALRGARDEGLFHILLLHTDVEGQLNRPIPALSVEKLKELRLLVNYVALGHTHKRFEVENWAFNPGSLEACSIDEYREERGLYLVEVDDADHVSATFINDYVQRPFQRLTFDVSGVEDPKAVHAGVMEMIKREARVHDPESDSPAPIIEINLRGHLGFKNSNLDLRSMREEALTETGALHVMLKNQSVPVEYAVAAGLDADTSRAYRERRIVEDLIARDTRYRDRAPEMAELVLEAKRRALSDEPPEVILELIEQKIEPRTRDDNAAAATEVGAAPSPSALDALERSATTAATSDN